MVGLGGEAGATSWQVVAAAAAATMSAGVNSATKVASIVSAVASSSPTELSQPLLSLVAFSVGDSGLIMRSCCSAFSMEIKGDKRTVSSCSSALAIVVSRACRELACDVSSSNMTLSLSSSAVVAAVVAAAPTNNDPVLFWGAVCGVHGLPWG